MNTRESLWPIFMLVAIGLADRLHAVHAVPLIVQPGSI